MTGTVPTTQQVAADAALALELIGTFYANQIDAGAVLHGEVAAHIRACADAVAQRLPYAADQLGTRAEAMIAKLPAGWAEGDGDWVEPA